MRTVISETPKSASSGEDIVNEERGQDNVEGRKRKERRGGGGEDIKGF